MRKPVRMAPRTQALVVAGIAAALGCTAFVLAYFEEDARHGGILAAVGVFILYGAARLAYAVVGRSRWP
ncbi:hypothetical protein [Myxococcus landrumensis]|uniref:Lipoprotein n=1 Tax=Myxococcus landrumensis TaxID=2813577 RepID=A0ABX7NEF9_9BACT|nr:hypothetical protein [Myxococcus landrumus]QSQ17207.1 hypothetical protein JY572_14595 [Myxococcus landrumus]